MFLKKVKHATALTALVCVTGQTFALEPGAAPQAPAGNTIGIPLSAPLPPGLYYTNSTKFLQGQLKDADGNNRGLELNAPASTSIFIYTPGVKVLGGDYRAWLAVPLIMAEETISNPMFGPVGKHSKTALANIDLHFADVTWTLAPGQFVSSGLGVIATTGYWKQGKTATSGNYWSINPRVGYSFMNPDWNISLEGHYFYNFENSKNKYDSGDELFIDATFLKKFDFLEGIQIGPVAYVREQVTADKNNGTQYHGTTSGKARQIGVGAQVLKDFGKGRFVGVNWSKDIETRNTVSNDGRFAVTVSAPIYMKQKPKPADSSAKF